VDLSVEHVELVYDTSPRTTTRAARGGSLIGLRFSMLK
jgi:hypothetical protein